MIDFSKAYHAEWHLYRVDEDTWADSEEVRRFMSASFNRETDGDAPEIDSGSMKVETSPAEEWVPGYYRLAMRAIQHGAERVDVATVRCESSSGTVNYGIDSKDIACLSVLHPAATTDVARGEFAAAGEDGAQKAARMLQSCIKAPILVEGSFSLADHYNFDVGMKVLEACWILLKAGGFCMYPDGRGIVHIAPMPTVPVLDLNRANAKLLGNEVTHGLDYSEVPNRYTADDDGVIAIAMNTDPSSPTSYQARGYWVDADYDDSPTRLEGETLARYAERMLEELSTVDNVRSYERAYVADVHVFSMVRGSMPSVLLDGDMRVKSQSIDCSHGVRITETAAKEVRAWTASQS